MANDFEFVVEALHFGVAGVGDAADERFAADVGEVFVGGDAAGDGVLRQAHARKVEF